MQTRDGWRFAIVIRMLYSSFDGRSARFTVGIAVMTCFIFTGLPAGAQTRDALSIAAISPVEPAVAPAFAPAALASTPTDEASDDRRPRPAPSDRIGKRGLLFAALEASHLGLQTLDTITTLRGLDAGLGEGNPLMRDLAQRPAAFVAVKAATAVGTTMLVRRVADRNRVAGILLMTAIDSAYSVIVARNIALTHAHRPR